MTEARAAGATARGGDDLSNETPRLSVADCERAISTRFAAQVRRHPDRIAVQEPSRALSYAELSHEVTRLARAIRSATSAEEEAVGVLLDQGAGLVAALLAILEAGRIAVPLDRSYPAARTRFMLEDSGARLVVCDGATADLVPDGMRRLALDGTAEARESRSAEPDARAGAVILYTSGSSGQPKGVLYDHVSFLHTAMTYCHALGIDADDRIALVFTASAFGGIRDILAAVLNGATLLPYDLRTRGVL